MLRTHLDLRHQRQRVVPHLDGSRQLAGQRHPQDDAVGGRGEDPTQDDAFAERVRHDGRDDDHDGGEEVRGAVEVTQRTDLPRQRHLVPEDRKINDFLNSGFDEIVKSCCYQVNVKSWCLCVLHHDIKTPITAVLILALTASEVLLVNHILTLEPRKDSRG